MSKAPIVDPAIAALWDLPDPTLLTEANATALLDLGKSTLRDWRAKGIVPPDWEDLQADPEKTKPIIRYSVGELKKAREQARKRAKAARAKVSVRHDSPYDLSFLTPMWQGERRPGIRHDTLEDLLANGTPADEWLFALAPLDTPNLKRPVDLVWIMRNRPELLGDDEVAIEQMSLVDYSSRLATYTAELPIAIKLVDRDDIEQPQHVKPRSKERRA